MSIIVTNIRTHYKANVSEIISEALRCLKLNKNDIADCGIFRESLDLRHGKISKISSVELSLHSSSDEKNIAENNNFVYLKPIAEMPVITGTKKLSNPPVVIGFGPAGMFAALTLAERGFKPIVVERGASIDDRDKIVNAFFEKGQLNENCNIQFGEGGAGAYSDGKLTTRINDPICQLVLEQFRKNGAPEESVRLAKPHIGTDLLKKIVKSIRCRIEQLGGKVYFNTQVTDFIIRDGVLKSVVTSNGVIDTQIAVLAIGHSARDTISTLYNRGVEITPKAFSVGLRVEHLQSWINSSIYGKYAFDETLPSAEYSLSAKPYDRGCYSFCMCPGGFVIAAASEEGGVVSNGMSYHARNGKNANSAICVSVGPNDFDSNNPLSGIDFQRKLERAAFVHGGSNYYAPVQTVGDLLNGKSGTEPKTVIPTYPIGYKCVDFANVLPDFVVKTLRASMPDFAKKVSCFGESDAVFTGVETRTSSPVRVVRDISLNSANAIGIMPCGEGAGYAGGIMSAAVDGVKVAGAIMNEYCI